MLSVLRIQNLAIVDAIEIEFGPGLNVLTGETGAGKSIILRAIDLLSGKRASADVIRAGADKCTVEALFILRPHTQELLCELADELTELGTSDELLIKRVLDTSGRSKLYVNGSLITAQLLQRISGHLVDLTGQHQQQSLLEEHNHLALLDHFGVDSELKSNVREQYRVFAKIQRDLDLLVNDSKERRRYFERLKAEADELSAAALQTGEREELEAEQKRLANFEALSSDVQSALELLEETDDSVDRKLRTIDSFLRHALSLDPAIGSAVESLDAASVQLDEVKFQLTTYAAGLDGDPARLEFLRERITEIAKLERKYQMSTDELIAYGKKISAEIAELDGEGFDVAKLTAKRNEARAALTVLEQRLTEERKKAAVSLAKLVEEGLGELSMKRARFQVEVEATESGPDGADLVRFALAANPGEPLRPLAKVASGGELSRLLLVMKTVLNDRDRPATQIFDEIDSGVGGAVAQAIGEKLLKVSAHSQVLVVSHSPQIAASAQSHFLIEKSTTGERTSTKVVLLDHEGRVQQIASMLAGKEITKNFADSAAELLRQVADQGAPQGKRAKKPSKNSLAA